MVKWDKVRTVVVIESHDSGFKPKNASPTVKHNGGNMMLWCYFIESNKKEGRLHQILEYHLKSTLRWSKPQHSCMFQLDNHPKHTSRLILEWIKQDDIKPLETVRIRHKRQICDTTWHLTSLDEYLHLNNKACVQKSSLEK